MITVTKATEFATLEDGNRLVGELPEMVNSTITFSGKGNVIFCEKKVKLVNTKINFNADNSIVFLCENSHNYILNVGLYNDNVFYSGKNNYFNGALNIILSEQKHFFVGDDCLFSFGIWARTADPHLIYDGESHIRINPTRSIFIGDHVWVGQSAMLLKGTQISSGSIVGAMSVVSGKKIDNNSSWAGNPAKFIKNNIFWNDPCVHTWKKDKTESFRKQESNAVIYKYSKKEYIPFNDIDSALDAENSVEHKLEFLSQITANKNKNRFVAAPQKKRWFKK